MSVKARFWAKINKAGPWPEDRRLGRCWIWTASKRHKGYGAFAYTDENGRLVQERAHRLAFLWAGGRLTRRKPCALHKCDRPACCRPSHVFAGSIAENNADMTRKGRRVPGGTHCGDAGRWKRGEAHPNAKLTVADVVAIRRRAECADCTTIARAFGIGVSHASRIINGKLWRHVA